MTQPLGVALTFDFFFWKAGVLANPAVAPTCTLYFPDDTTTTLSLTNPNTGEYRGTLPGGSNTQVGAYKAIAATTDASMDNMNFLSVWESGTNDAVTITNDVWNEQLAGHQTNGSAGFYLFNAGGSNSPATIAAAVWNYVLNAPLTAGQILLSILAKLGVTPVQVSNPINALQTIVGPLIPGDDYLFIDGQQISIVSPYTGLSLVGGSVVYRGTRIGGGTLVVNGVIVDATHCYIELTAAQTNQLLQGTFSVEATLTSGHILTLAYGGQQVQIVQ